MDIVNCKDCYNENCKDRGVNLRSMCWAYKGHPQPQTNADRIRAKTDEELAEWIFRNQMSLFKLICDAFGYTEYDEKKMEHWEDILAWLKQEAE